MPTYEYACQRCDERIEVVQSFSDKPLRTHRGCGGSLQKVFHASGVVFKGSGFYVTDSRRGSSNGSASTSTTGSSARTSTDTKPAGEKKDSVTSSPGSSDSGSSKPGTSSSGTSSASTSTSSDD